MAVLIVSCAKEFTEYFFWPFFCLPSAVVESPEEGGEEGADGQDGGGEEASEHRPPGPAGPPQPAAGAHQDRPADWLQPRSPRPSSAPTQPDQAHHPAGSHQRHQADVSFLARSSRNHSRSIFCVADGGIISFHMETSSPQIEAETPMFIITF